jgi:LacI family sucrose operon transcriptional repressor|nr:LacI family DNA-binding transcriptional regulator [uncultured Blautia sp.]
MNINEIAKLAGVSRATVSRYLNNGYVSEEKKKIIRQVIEETGYQPSSQAQMLRTKKTKLVGVILPKIDSNTISREVAGISDILTKQGYQLILANTNNSIEEELKYLSLFKDNQVDGVIFIATILTKQHRDMLKEYKVPIVVLGQHLEGYPCIYQDDYKAAMSLTEQMVKTGRKFGYITVTDKDEAVGRKRMSGVEEILNKNKIKLKTECVKCGAFTMESGYEMAEELFREHPDIDTLICATDTMAVGAVNWLKKNGYQIPQQVQVAGMGDSSLGKIIEPKLTTVHFFYKTSGMESAKMLVDLMESDEVSIHKEIKMGCKVVLRESHRNA